ncbi:MAG TPA: THUMP domain-containing protein [Quisquiliibacterium sp.]|nr:THUMP domain-containing protein [Quisquiliibacterium sp.]
MTALHYFAPCPRGLEQALADELLGIGARIEASVGGGVAFSGDHATGYSANLHSRIASRVLLKVAEGRYRDDDDLYRLANRCEWERWFDVRRTLRVDVSAMRSPLRSLNFATLRIKDGAVDRFRTRTGARPSIDTEQPDVRIFGFLDERNAVLYLDLSGEPLFKRGWRSERDDKGEAPLKENLAAGLLALAQWDPQQPLYDPFCGSGTIVIEAAQRALGIAPGLSRRFGFENLLDFDAPLWAKLHADAVRSVQSAGGAAARALRVAASDIDARSLEQVERNALRAGLPPGAIRCSRCDVLQARPPFDAPGVIVTNPPYGERLELHAPARRSVGPAGTVAVGSGLEAWMGVGRALKDHFGGWRLWMLTSDLDLPRHLNMKARRRTPLYNGAIECRLFGFEIFGPVESGSPAAPAPGAPG